MAVSKILADALGKDVFKNYIINGAMMISQENPLTALTASATFPVDQFAMFFTNAGTQTAVQVASATPGGSPNRLRITATAADASVAVGDFLIINHLIEGLRVADLRSGSASAKTITLQFGCKGPAGTYCVSIRNSAATRCYVAEYTISAPEANTDVVKSVTIALDQTGTWLVDTGTGFNIAWTLMAGTSLQQAAGSWTGANMLASANQFNFMGTISNVFELFDVSLTVGTVAPAFVVPDYTLELNACMRYYEKAGFDLEMPVTSGQDYGHAGYFSIPFRATPTLAAADSSTTNLGAPTSLAMVSASLTTFAYRKRASGTGAAVLASSVTGNARL